MTRLGWWQMARWHQRWLVTGAVGLVVVGVAVPTLGAGAISGTPRTTGTHQTAGNLLAGNQAGSSPGTGSWIGTNARVAAVRTRAPFGSGVLAVTDTAPAAAAMSVTSGSTSAATTPAVPGRVYTGRASVLAAGAARSSDAVLDFLSPGGASLGSSWGQVDPDSPVSWHTTVPAVGLAPPGTASVELAVVFYQPGLGETHYVSGASITTHPSGSARITGPLTTSTNHIEDRHGRAVTLRGTVSEWLDYNPSALPGSQLDNANISHMKQWGDNVVRVLLNESTWTAGDCGYSAGYSPAVDQVVRSITSRGMVAVLNLHSNGRTRCDPAAQQRMADVGAVRFWKAVARRYKANPLVAFDLYNEPHDITWSQWLRGGTLTDTDGVIWRSAGMAQLYRAVRSTGARNLVFVSGNTWANDPPPLPDLLRGFNIVYAVHAYTCQQSLPPACNYPDPTAAPGYLSSWEALAGAVPVAVTEFGWPDPGGSTYNSNVIAWAESQGIGWMAYGWYRGGVPGPSTPHFGILADSYNFEPEASGMPVLAGLSRNS